MRPRTLPAALAVLALLAGCGGADDPPSADLPDPPAVGTAPTFPTAPAPTTTQATPTGAPVAEQAWTRALGRYCSTTTGAVQQLFTAADGPADPLGALERLGRRYRAGVERLAAVQPPATRRDLQLQIVAEGRESAARLDAALRTARAGDIDEATGVAAELGGLLPDLPDDVLRAAPACRNEAPPAQAAPAG